MVAPDLPIDISRDVFYDTDGALAYVGHSPSFVEIAFVVAGGGTHLSLGDPQRLDVVVLRPGGSERDVS